MNQQINYVYEIIIVDLVGKSEITTVKSLSNALAYSEKLWQNSIIQETQKESTIEDKVLGIRLQVKKVESTAKETTFLLSASSSNFEEIEKFRQKLLVHIVSKLGFVNARVISDTISEQISLSIYPLVKEVENTVRRNLTKVFLQKEGLSWWENTASKTVIDKVNQRRSVANVFNSFVDTNAILTDFNDLNELIQKSPFSDSNFRSKWEALSLIKDKITTYAPLVAEDYSTTQKLSKEILEVLSENENRTESVNLSSQTTKKVAAPLTPAQEVTKVIETAKEQPTHVEEKIVVETPVSNEVPVANVPVEPIKSVPHQAPATSVKTETAVLEKEVAVAGNDLISESEFLNELKRVESVSSGEFIDLKSFVSTVLANKGYATGFAYSLSRVLNENGKVALYDAKEQGGLMVRAIRSL